MNKQNFDYELEQKYTKDGDLIYHREKKTKPKNATSDLYVQFFSFLFVIAGFILVVIGGSTLLTRMLFPANIPSSTCQK